MIKKYFQFLKEQDEFVDDSIDLNVPKEEETEPKEEKSSSNFEEVQSAIKELIENTVEKSGGEFETLKDSFLKDPKEIKIEGLINDSDIYDFYLKYRNDIDEILGDIKFYDENPSEMNVFGLYEYTIKGTMKAVEEFVKKT